jgi:integrase
VATLKKVTTTQWIDPVGNRVKPNTPGATKRVVTSRKWYIVAKVNGRVKRIPAYTDKKASQAKLADWLRAQERGQADLIDPFKEHLDRPVLDHLADYVRVLKTRSRNPDYHGEVERSLRRVFAARKVVLLRDLTADAVQQYLAALVAGATTKNLHRTYVVSFCNYLVAARRLPANPVTRFTVSRAKPREAEERRERRALKPSEIRRLLAAVRDYPLKAASTNTGGRPPAGTAGQPRTPRPAKLSAGTVAKLEHRGRERLLLYRVGLMTGLRRGELSRLRVRHLDLGPQPRIDLPGTLTKNGKRACIPLVPSLADELRQWIADTGRAPGDPLLSVPARNNLSRMHRAHLELAAIPYQDDRGRYCDFHSLRKSANAYLRRNGVPPKERQLFLRHGKLELTTETYDDDQMTGMKTVYRRLAKLIR